MWNNWGKITFFPLAARGERQKVSLVVQMEDGDEYRVQTHPDELQLNVSGPSGTNPL